MGGFPGELRFAEEAAGHLPLGALGKERRPEVYCLPSPFLLRLPGFLV